MIMKEGKQDMELFQVVDKDGNTLQGMSRHAKPFYRKEPVARGVATQLNSITVIKNGEGVQIEGAPFKVKKWVAYEA